MSGNGVCRHCKEAGRSFHNSQTHFNEVTFFLSGAERSKDIHPLQGDALEFPNHPTFLHKEGFNPNPKPLSPLQDRDLTQKTAETDGFLPFWYRGTRDEFFDGWRRIIYYHANTPRGMGARRYQKEEKWRKSCKIERNSVTLPAKY